METSRLGEDGKIGSDVKDKRWRKLHHENQYYWVTERSGKGDDNICKCFHSKKCKILYQKRCPCWSAGNTVELTPTICNGKLRLIEIIGN